jgi:hypothetical protein
MKRLVAGTLCALGMTLATSAVEFDINAFGDSLNGWRKDRAAHYTMDNHSYATHVPTVSRTHGGGLFISTRIECKARAGKAAVSHLELAFSPEGHLISGQVRVTVNGKRLNTGQVTRAPQSAPAPPAEDGTVPADPEPWKTATTQIVMDLFSALDTEFAKLEKADTEGKKDVFGRLFGKGFDSADLAAALRHNMNLMLGFVD